MSESRQHTLRRQEPMSASAKRRRRVRRTLLTLAVLGAASSIGGYAYYLSNRPVQYRPGEDMDEITQALARSLPPGAPQVKLVDVTEAVGLGGFRSFLGDRTSQLPEDMGCGAAWGDFDNDGDDDLFVVSNGAALNSPPELRSPCALYECLDDGTFREDQSFPQLRIIGMGCAWGDYTGDGWLDLIVTGYNALLLFRNEEGTLIRDSSFADVPGFWAGASWGDFDNDRDLDLYVCGYVEYKERDADSQRDSLQYGTSLPYTLNPSSYEPTRNLLFRNDGGGKLVEVAESMGVANAEGRSLGAVWHDFDQDGWLDLYVANDISDNAFYRNVEGRFVEISHAAWVADYRGAMGLAVGDYDRDGDDDLFVSHWTAQENALYHSMLVESRDEEGPMRTGREDPRMTDEMNYATVQFVDFASATGLGQIALQRIGWGADFADFDGDGWMDLPVANGSTFETDDSPRELRTQRSFLFWNQESRYFHDVSQACLALREPHVTRGLALSDFDMDGDVDLLLVHRDSGVQLLRNDMQVGHWLEVRLKNRLSDGSLRGFGDGSTVIVYAGGVGHRRTVNSVSYLSQSSRTLHFGLGQESEIDRIDVHWHAGKTQSFHGATVDGIWKLEEGEDQPEKIAVDTPLDERDRIRQFWEVQRAGVNAMKVEDDPVEAIEYFQTALELDVDHEDARFYLASCLAMTGDVSGAIVQLEELLRRHPRSHRALKQLALLKVDVAVHPEDLNDAMGLLDRAWQLNREETGVLLAMGEVHLLLGQTEAADEKLALATRTNHQAQGGFLLRAYIAWERRDETECQSMLQRVVHARGPEWKPEGATSEGDVSKRHHVEPLPLARFQREWQGSADTERVFHALRDFIQNRFPTDTE